MRHRSNPVRFAVWFRENPFSSSGAPAHTFIPSLLALAFARTKTKQKHQRDKSTKITRPHTRPEPSSARIVLYRRTETPSVLVGRAFGVFRRTMTFRCTATKIVIYRVIRAERFARGIWDRLFIGVPFERIARQGNPKACALLPPFAR